MKNYYVTKIFGFFFVVVVGKILIIFHPYNNNNNNKKNAFKQLFKKYKRKLVKIYG